MSNPLDKLLLLGDERLYQVCTSITDSELSQVAVWVAEMAEVMQAVRQKYGFGRAIAAPQVGIMKRLVYLHIDRPMVFINPEISYPTAETFELWDDCMSFPNLLVKVRRHKEIVLHYRDRHWQPQTLLLRDDLAELLQHECDHLDGVLCTMRAIDSQSFRWRP
ncbi:peptide deformylase [Eisenibacter elegans]|jgi:peptide deformylase|uniref:peptide deformylase n=1 Tax=Eisenibacter elegans TaxID=997 RepID=UPI0003FF3691|nr:peptide deformylase [Eisenibacter elegans]